MRVQSKITLLLAFVVVAFLGGLLALRTYDRFKFHRIAQERLKEREHSLDRFLEHNGAALAALVEDYTNWDQLVRAIEARDTNWLAQNLTRATLDSFHAHGIWVYDPNGELVYPLIHPDFDGSPDFPIPPDQFPKLFAQKRLLHFFVDSPYGVMEVRAGTIHRSRDFKRESKPEGYLFAVRIWNQPVLNEMTIFTGNSLRIIPAQESPPRLGSPDERNGTIAFSRTLPGWDGRPVAQLAVRNESPVVKELNRESTVHLISLILFALLLLLLISFSLSRSVRRPLAVIMQSLERNDPRPIEPMSREHSEFGELARTVRSFFNQRDNLIREVEDRRATEQALRKKEEELRQSQKMEAIGQLAGGVAHDFNNLLTAIIGYAELISSRYGVDVQARQSALLISKAGTQAATLTRQLLAFSRKQLLQPRVLDLNSLVLDMEKLLRRVIGERIDVQTFPEAVDSRVKADPGQLEQVLLNLGVNARDAMSQEGGTVTIRTRNEHLEKDRARQLSRDLPAGPYVVLSVQDTGVGMDEQTKARIFEPFFTTKEAGQGTGLGLAMVYGIVRQSGGAIAVESEPNRGTTFRVYLPFEHAPIEQTKSLVRKPVNRANSETIFVVEDDPAVRQLVCDVLEDAGYVVLCASDGPDAMRMVNRHAGDVHLLVSDVVMPKITGPQLASRLCQTRPEMKVLYLSGYSANDIGDHGVLTEQIELLQKPFTPHTLLERVRQVLDTEVAWGADGANANGAQLQLAI